jgi:hypothetical protein
MLFIVSAPELIGNLWQLKAAVFLHRCLICAVPLAEWCWNVSASTFRQSALSRTPFTRKVILLSAFKCSSNVCSVECWVFKLLYYIQLPINKISIKRLTFITEGALKIHQTLQCQWGQFTVKKYVLMNKNVF